MHKVKVLFLIAVSFFLFAAGFRLLAAQPAQAQSAGLVECAYASETSSAVVIDGYLWRQQGQYAPEQLPARLSARAIACNYTSVVLETGEILNWSYTEWAPRGTFPIGATPAKGSSQGQVRVRWR